VKGKPIAHRVNLRSAVLRRRLKAETRSTKPSFLLRGGDRLFRAKQSRSTRGELVRGSCCCRITRAASAQRIRNRLFEFFWKFRTPAHHTEASDEIKEIDGRKTPKTRSQRNRQVTGVFRDVRDYAAPRPARQIVLGHQAGRSAHQKSFRSGAQGENRFLGFRSEVNGTRIAWDHAFRLCVCICQIALDSGKKKQVWGPSGLRFQRGVGALVRSANVGENPCTFFGMGSDITPPTGGNLD